MRALAIIIALLAATATITAATIRNPSGSCGARNDGSHSAGNARWVPDCQNPLRREYWRVFVKPGGEAYVMPRPDGAPELHAICAGNDEMRVVVDRYGLCTGARSLEQARIVNAMDLSDALLITHYLHGRLKFSAMVGPDGIANVGPYPIPSDIADACAISQDRISAGLAAHCERVRHRYGLEFFMNREAAEDLADRLNELYGIK